MKQRYRMFRRENGIYYSLDSIGNKRNSLNTTIPEAFIRRAHEMFQLPIGSSKELLVESQFQPGVKVFAERHSEDAEKVWKRLLNWGEAYRDESAGRYFYPVKGQTTTAEKDGRQTDSVNAASQENPHLQAGHDAGTARR